MSKYNDNDMESIAEEIDGEETSVHDDDDDDETDEEDLSYIETLTQEILESHDDLVQSYNVDPQTPQEMSENAATKKFLVQKVRDKLLESYECQLRWTDEEQLAAMLKKCKRELSKDDELDALTVMKRIIKQEPSIKEIVEAAIEEQMDVDDEDNDDEQ
jgi:hypothetical protein